MTTYTIYPLLLMSFGVDKSKMTYMMNCGELVELAVVSWYIKADEETKGKNILVDTGTSIEKFNKVYIDRYGSLPDKEATVYQTMDQALSKYNLTPQDIDYVIQTHLHLDHCANTRMFTNAKVIVQKDEISFAYSPHTFVLGEYIKEYFIDVKWEIVSGDVEILPGLKVILTPGHTPGSQSVAIQTKKGLAVITGFCSTNDTFNVLDSLKENWPVYAPGVHTDVLAAFDSALKVKAMADILIPLHELSLAKKDKIPE